MAVPDEGSRARASSTPTRPGGGGGDRAAANPQKLRDYATTGSQMLATLRSKQQALHAALEALRPHASSEYVPSLEAIDRQIDTLIADWEHLDTFVGDVGDAFAAVSEVDNDNSVLDFTEAQVAAVAQVGYANRDEAIEAAEAAAERFAELRALLADEHGWINRADVEAFIEMFEVGQYDPAFAVAFSEAVGVEGYTNAVGMIRETYMPDDLPSERLDTALAAVAVLGTTLTTALETRHRPAGAQDRLSTDFVDDLTGDYEPDGRYVWDGTQRDLSVLLRHTDPPTRIAVEIAQGRMTPLLTELGYIETIAPEGAWGNHSGPVTNYMEMLDRNQDASALWLARNPPGEFGSNMELVLQYPGEAFYDDGEVLASVVENGLTSDHPGVITRTVDPDTGESIRTHDLMVEAIEAIGDDDLEQIHNPHLHDAFAAGVEHNMETIDHMINRGWDTDNSSGQPGQSVEDTHDFLRELMRDEDAADRVVAASQDYVIDEIRQAPPSGVDTQGSDFSDDRRDAMARLGNVQGLVTQAESNAIGASLDEYIARQEGRAGRTDLVVSLVPYLGDGQETVGRILDAGASLNDIAQTHGVSLGDHLFPVDEDRIDETDETINALIADADLNNLVYLAIGGHEADAPPDVQRLLDGSVSQLEPADRQRLVDWAFTVVDSADWDAMYHGTDIMEEFNDRADRRR